MTHLAPKRCGKLAVPAVAAAFLCMGLLGRSTAHAEKANLVADDQEALLVFVRPASTDRKNKKINKYPFIIMDSEATAVAGVYGGSYSIVRSKPGKHNFYMFISIDPLRQIRVDLDAGRTYIVLVEVDGVKRKLVCIRRGSPAFDGSADLLRTNEWDHIESLRIGSTGKDLKKKKDKIRKADERWEGFSRDEQEWRNLQPEDGRTAEEMRALKFE